MAKFLERPLALMQWLLPQHFLTSLIHWLMRVRVSWIKNSLIRVIGKTVGVNFDEAKSSQVSDYCHFNDFFTRSLREGARPLDPSPDSLLCPCDGVVSERGQLDDDRLLQAKGHYYQLGSLLADDPAVEALRGGNFWTIYLSPRDYHRVHMPLAGTLRSMTYVPGKLFSVAPYTVRHIPDLFARNERVVSVFETHYGPCALVLVGAMLVGSMETVWAGMVTPSKTRVLTRERYEHDSISFNRGDEMGRFNMGSTVILLLPPGAVQSDLQPFPAAGEPVQMGRRLAALKQH